MAYIGKAPNTAIVNQATSQSFSGNGSTTAFTLTRSVNVGEDLEVFVNNVQQEPGSGKSYTASGTTLTFDEAPPSGTGNVYVIYRGEATINPRLEHDANAALSATTGTFSGAVSGTTGTFSGAITSSSGATITTADNSTQLTLKSTDADNNIGPQLDLRRDSGSPADGDVLGRVRWLVDDDAGNMVESAILQSNLEDASQGTVDTELQITTSVASTMRNRMKITSSEVSFNEDSIDSDFRVEGNGNANAFFVQGSDDFIGVGTGAPKKKIHIQDTTSDGIMIFDANGTTTDHQICFAHNYQSGGQSGGKYYAIGVDGSEDRLAIAYDANSQASLSADSVMVIKGSNGRVSIGTNSTAFRFNVISNQSDYVAQFDRNVDIDGNFRNHIVFRRGGTSVGEIQCSSSATQYGTSSDHRLKENVEDMTGAIARVKQLSPKRFSWIIDELDSPNFDGFLAHEAQTVVPQAVSGTHNAVDDDGEAVMQGIDHSMLVPLLTAALKEAVAKIETLEARVAALEGN